MNEKNKPGAAGGPRPGSRNTSPDHFSRVAHLPLAAYLKRSIVYAAMHGAVSPTAAQRLIQALRLKGA
jgi:hypothetical protein